MKCIVEVHEGGRCGKHRSDGGRLTLVMAAIAAALLMSGSGDAAAATTKACLDAVAPIEKSMDKLRTSWADGSFTDYHPHSGVSSTRAGLLKRLDVQRLALETYVGLGDRAQASTLYGISTAEKIRAAQARLPADATQAERDKYADMLAWWAYFHRRIIREKGEEIDITLDVLEAFRDSYNMKLYAFREKLQAARERSCQQDFGGFCEGTGQDFASASLDKATKEFIDLWLSKVTENDKTFLNRVLTDMGEGSRNQLGTILLGNLERIRDGFMLPLEALKAGDNYAAAMALGKFGLDQAANRVLQELVGAGTAGIVKAGIAVVVQSYSELHEQTCLLSADLEYYNAIDGDPRLDPAVPLNQRVDYYLQNYVYGDGTAPSGRSRLTHRQQAQCYATQNLSTDVEISKSNLSSLFTSSLNRATDVMQTVKPTNAVRAVIGAMLNDFDKRRKYEESLQELGRIAADTRLTALSQISNLINNPSQLIAAVCTHIAANR